MNQLTLQNQECFRINVDLKEESTHLQYQLASLQRLALKQKHDSNLEKERAINASASYYEYYQSSIESINLLKQKIESNDAVYVSGYDRLFSDFLNLQMQLNHQMKTHDSIESLLYHSLDSDENLAMKGVDKSKSDIIINRSIERVQPNKTIIIPQNLSKSLSNFSSQDSFERMILMATDSNIDLSILNDDTCPVEILDDLVNKSINIFEDALIDPLTSKLGSVLNSSRVSRESETDSDILNTFEMINSPLRDIINEFEEEMKLSISAILNDSVVRDSTIVFDTLNNLPSTLQTSNWSLSSKVDLSTASSSITNSIQKLDSIALDINSSLYITDRTTSTASIHTTPNQVSTVDNIQDFKYEFQTLCKHYLQTILDFKDDLGDLAIINATQVLEYNALLELYSESECAHVESSRLFYKNSVKSEEVRKLVCLFLDGWMNKSEKMVVFAEDVEYSVSLFNESFMSLLLECLEVKWKKRENVEVQTENTLIVKSTINDLAKVLVDGATQMEETSSLANSQESLDTLNYESDVEVEVSDDENNMNLKYIRRMTKSTLQNTAVLVKKIYDDAKVKSLNKVVS